MAVTTGSRSRWWSSESLPRRCPACCSQPTRSMTPGSEMSSMPPPVLGRRSSSGSVTPEHVISRPRRASSGPTARGRHGEQDLTIAALDKLPCCSDWRINRRGRIVEQFGRPQDIEWAFDGRNAMDRAVQTDDRTATGPAEPQPGSNGLRQRPLAELLPIRPFPLDMTTWTTRGHGRDSRFACWRRFSAVTVDLQADAARSGRGRATTTFHPLWLRPTWRTLITPLRMRSRIRRFRPDGVDELIRARGVRPSHLPT